MRYRLRTLLIVLALGPPFLAAAWWTTASMARESHSLAFAVAVLTGLIALACYTALIFLIGILAARLIDAVIDRLARLINRR